MKKFTLLLLAAALLPMTMNAEVKTYGQMNKKADKVVVSSTPTSVKAIGPKYVTGTKADVRCFLTRTLSLMAPSSPSKVV